MGIYNSNYIMYIINIKYHLLSSGIGIELARLGSIAARVLAIASSKAELPVWFDGDIGKGTSPGGTSALSAAL